MKISFITLFPNFIDDFKKHSIIKNALNANLIEIENIDIRNFSDNKHNKIDDYVYGGGAGMLIMVEPVVKAIESIKTDDSYVILLGPKGRRFNQNIAKDFKNSKTHLILLCGHYEGIDSRIKYFIDEEISIGDFILTSGELSAMVIADAIIRLVPGVIKNSSSENESFENNRLEYDQFTKPNNFRGYSVPKILLSGNHRMIEKWKKESSIINTMNFILKKDDK